MVIAEGRPFPSLLSKMLLNAWSWSTAFKRELKMIIRTLIFLAGQFQSKPRDNGTYVVFNMPTVLVSRDAERRVALAERYILRLSLASCNSDVSK